MIKYIVARSQDGGQWCLTSMQNWHEQPQLQVDTEGVKMITVKVFYAITYEEAQAVFETVKTPPA